MKCRHCHVEMHTLNKLRQYHPACRESRRNQRRALTTTGAMTAAKVDRIVATHQEEVRLRRREIQ